MIIFFGKLRAALDSPSRGVFMVDILSTWHYNNITKPAARRPGINAGEELRKRTSRKLPLPMRPPPPLEDNDVGHELFQICLGHAVGTFAL